VVCWGERTAGPSATLRFGRVDSSVWGLAVTAGPSATLRFGRDDSSVGGGKNRKSLRYASLRSG
jgi:hypothetical protein